MAEDTKIEWRLVPPCPKAACFGFLFVLIQFMSYKQMFWCSSIFMYKILLCESRDSSVGIALGYGLDDWGSMVRFPAGAGNFSLNHRVQNGSGAHPASYAMGARGSFPGGKADGA
jgi:hypothetical protein